MTFDAQERSVAGGAPVELYEFVRGVDRWRYTSANQPVTYGQQTYDPVPIQRSDIGRARETESGRLTLRVPRDHEVAALFRVYVPASTMWLTIYRRHLTDADLETLVIWQGRVRSVAWSGSEARIDCESSVAMLKREALRLSYQRLCNHMLYSSACGVSQDAYRTPVTVTAVSDTTITAAEFASQPDGWWTAGLLVRNGEDYRMIMSHAGQDVTVLLPFEGLQAEDVLDAYPGCDRSRSTCESKFNNLLNFGGFPFIPVKNPFESGVT